MPRERIAWTGKHPDVPALCTASRLGYLLCNFCLGLDWVLPFQRLPPLLTQSAQRQARIHPAACAVLSRRDKKRIHALEYKVARLALADLALQMLT